MAEAILVQVLSRTGATRPQQRLKIMVAIGMPREFVSHPVMKQVSGILIISLCVGFKNQIVKQLANFDYFSYQLCSNYLLRLESQIFWPYLSVPIAMPSFSCYDPRLHFVHSLEGTDDWV
jgi:hypothetical protein